MASDNSFSLFYDDMIKPLRVIAIIVILVLFTSEVMAGQLSSLGLISNKERKWFKVQELTETLTAPVQFTPLIEEVSCSVQ